MVILRSVPPRQRIAVIKDLGETMPQLDLRQARDLVENTPSEILQGLPPRVVEAAVRRLQALGADVEVESTVFADDRPASPGPNADLCWRREPILKNVRPDRRIAAIRVLREHIPNLGLGEAQEIVAATPSEIPTGGEPALADKVARNLRAIGVEVVLPGEIGHDQLAARVVRHAPMPTLDVPLPPKRTRIGAGTILAIVVALAAIAWLLKQL